MESVREYTANKDFVHVRDVLTNAIKMPLDAIKKPDEMRVAACLKELGWTKFRHAGVRYHRRQGSDAVPTKELNSRSFGGPDRP